MNGARIESYGLEEVTHSSQSGAAEGASDGPSQQSGLDALSGDSSGPPQQNGGYHARVQSMPLGPEAGRWQTDRAGARAKPVSKAAQQALETFKRNHQNASCTLNDLHGGAWQMGEGEGKAHSLGPEGLAPALERDSSVGLLAGQGPDRRTDMRTLWEAADRVASKQGAVGIDDMHGGAIQHRLTSRELPGLRATSSAVFSPARSRTGSLPHSSNGRLRYSRNHGIFNTPSDAEGSWQGGHAALAALNENATLRGMPASDLELPLRPTRSTLQAEAEEATIAWRTTAEGAQGAGPGPTITSASSTTESNKAPGSAGGKPPRNTSKARIRASRAWSGLLSAAGSVQSTAGVLDSPGETTPANASGAAVPPLAALGSTEHASHDDADALLQGEGLQPKGSGTREGLGAQLRLYSELLFFAGINDHQRLQKLVAENDIDISIVCDYDGRTPLHLAASEGAFCTMEWLLTQTTDVNPIDRFGHTPLMDALKAQHAVVAQLLIEANGMVLDGDRLKHPGQTPLYHTITPSLLQQAHHPDWEISVTSLAIGPVIGEGEFGVVHRARWEGTPIAVKLFKDCQDIKEQELATEISTLMKTHHPNIVQFFGASTRVEPYLIATELLAECSLEDALDQGIKLPLRRTLEIALDCVRGLGYLHGENPTSIIHRDLKPSNVMFSGSTAAMCPEEMILDTGIAKITDFGLSKSVTAQDVDNVLATRGELRQNGTFVVAKSTARENSIDARPSRDGDELDADNEEVQLSVTAAESHSVIELRCRDAGGLLSRVMELFSRLGLHVKHADVRTEPDGTVRDVFHVTDAAGRALDVNARLTQTMTAQLRTIVRSNGARSPGTVTASSLPTSPKREKEADSASPVVQDEAPALSATLASRVGLGDSSGTSNPMSQVPTARYHMTGGTGSYLYMAGEIFRHEPYNSSADVYSFAMILYEMVFGTRPFMGMDPITAAMKAATDGLRPLLPPSPAHFTKKDAEVLPQVIALIEACWSAQPLERPACHQMVPLLENLLASYTSKRLRYSDIVAERTKRKNNRRVSRMSLKSASVVLEKSAEDSRAASVSAVPPSTSSHAVVKEGLRSPFVTTHEEPHSDKGNKPSCCSIM